MTVWQGSFVVTRLPRVNQWHGATCIRGKSRIYEGAAWKKAKKELGEQIQLRFRVGHPPPAISTPVDAEITVSMWKRVDTDAPIKGILDCLEDARIVEDDKLIRDITVRREYHKRDEPDRVSIALISPEERR